MIENPFERMKGASDQSGMNVESSRESKYLISLALNMQFRMLFVDLWFVLNSDKGRRGCME